MTDKKTFKESTIENVKTIFYALLIAGVIRSFAYEPFHIPSGSMKDGLLVGDFILVSKYSYGYSKYSFPFGLVPIKGRVFDTKPERGDVVVFRLPAKPSINYIKRLIGMPGDKIQLKNGQVFINGKAVPQIPNGTYENQKNGLAERLEENLPNGKKYNVLNFSNNGIKDFTPIYEVPQGHYFFMGDNRDYSQDSRYLRKVGFVPEDHLVGKASLIFMSSRESLLKIWKWHKNIRFQRIFQKIN